MIKSISSYIRGSFEELSKVVWPTKNQAVKLTIIVLIFCLVSAVFLGAVDFGFAELHSYIIKL